MRILNERCGILYCGLYIEMKVKGRHPTPEQAAEVRQYFIPDFSSWKNHDAFEKAFAK